MPPEIQSAEDESIDLRTAITNAMQEVQERQDDTETQEAAQKRDDSGKFSKEEKVEEPDGKAGEANNAAETDHNAQNQEAEIAAPTAWKAEIKQHWANLPKEVQKYINEREAEVHKGFTKFDQERQFGKELKSVIDPYMSIINAENSTPAKAVQALMNTAYILRAGTPDQKLGALRGVMQQYGIDPSALLQNHQQQWVDPQVKQLQDRLNALEYEKAQRMQMEQSAVEAQANKLIEDFSSDPANVHYETVKSDMALLLQSGRAQDMKEAYDMACWANPSVRSSLISATQADANRAAATKAKAEQARRAGASVAGGPGGSSPGAANAPERSLRDELAENFRAATGGRI